MTVSAPHLHTDAPLVVRHATAADDPALRRLAQLDSATVPARPALLAEVDGEPVAALALATGQLVADPFVPTASVAVLLRVRAGQLASGGRARSGLRRLAPALLRPA